eukprot:Awhi_evm1s6720
MISAMTETETGMENIFCHLTAQRVVTIHITNMIPTVMDKKFPIAKPQCGGALNDG